MVPSCEDGVIVPTCANVVRDCLECDIEDVDAELTLFTSTKVIAQLARLNV